MVYSPPPELSSLSLLEIAELIKARKLPPIEKWAPTEILDSKMRIAASGQWFHEGRPIARAAMVRAFSSLLWRDEDGAHWLLTPQDKQTIEVEDAAFIAVDVIEKGPDLAFRLNSDELVIAGPDNPIIARGDRDAPALYLGLRHRLEARLNRSTYLQLAEIAMAHGEDWHVRSGGTAFSLIP